MVEYHKNILLAAIVLLVSCADKQDDFFTADEWKTVKSLSPLPDLPPNPTNKYADDPAAAAFGQRMFFDTGLSAGGLKVGNDSCAPGQPAGLPCPTLAAQGKFGDMGKAACASCHVPATWFNDNAASGRSTALTYSFRNDPSLVDAVYYTFTGWAGTGESLWVQSGTTAEGTTVEETRLTIAHRVYNAYKSDYEAIFGALPAALDPSAPDAVRFPANGRFIPPLAPGASGDDPSKEPFKTWATQWAAMDPADQDATNRIASNVFKSMEAYMRTLVSKNAPFDQYVAGRYGAISRQARNGLKVFITKANCTDCHSGPFFTDNKYHALGVDTGAAHQQALNTFAALAQYLPKETPGNLPSGNWSGAGAYSDDPVAGLQKLVSNGLMADPPASTSTTPPVTDTGKYRTKTLRHIAKTGPYMHDGSMADLAAVVRFYNQGGGDVSGSTVVKDPVMFPLELSDQDQSDLIVFLHTLTGDAPTPSQTANTAALLPCCKPDEIPSTVIPVDPPPLPAIAWTSKACVTPTKPPAPAAKCVP